MKRTKQAYFRPNPSQKQTEESSGVTFMIGEDHPFEDRKRYYQRIQKQFLDEQMEQKKLMKNSQKTTQKQYDQQLITNTHHRGQLELDKHSRLHEMERAHDDYNIQMAKQRKNREKQQQERLLEEQRRQLELLNQRKVKKVPLNQR